jgi:hypothetical protein
MKQKPSKTLNYEKAARSDLRLVQCVSEYDVLSGQAKQGVPPVPHKVTNCESKI